MRTGQGFVLTYAITSRQSYDEVNQFREQILRVKDADVVPIVRIFAFFHTLVLSYLLTFSYYFV